MAKTLRGRAAGTTRRRTVGKGGGVIVVKGHRRGSSIVKAYSRAASGRIGSKQRAKLAKILDKKIRIGNLLLDRRSDTGAVMGRIRYRASLPTTPL